MSTTSSAKVFFGEAADAYAQGAADGHERIRQLEELAAEILASYHQGSDGYRGRVGQVQIKRWQTRLSMLSIQVRA